MPRQYSACLARVSGSKPPTPFLDELVDWALLAPEELFQPNAVFDVYSAVVGQLGPYGIGAHRKAVILEVLRCLAGLESMWDWNHGVDGGKPQAKTSHNEEAGAWQVSADSMGNGQSLTDFVQDTLGATDDQTFITGMKTNHTFAIEYTVRLLRITINHWGPFVNSKSIFGQLNRASVKEFRGFLETIGDFPRPDPGMHYA
ncbi:MAG: hypothetical protein ISP49_10370 [Reyranella sp.]|jgi:hypothetical protein|nr:hypothetical protein [Reyranella sp.]MBL6651987.1 hypothetical protein [Reyranella sp.]